MPPVPPAARPPQRRIWLHFSGIIVLTTALAFLDYVSGYEITAFPLYALPIAWMAWRVGMWPAIILALGCAVVWVSVDLASGHDYSQWWIRYHNTLARLIFFELVAVSVAHLRRSLYVTRAEVRQLSSLLPVCSCCHSVQDTHGDWVGLETYLREKEGAEAVAKLCPRCAREKHRRQS